ncbi:hypothetical protein SAMN06298226_1935 [Nitrosovibrio sp. Nv4]|nr:hypothetical protein SAMN06298226_1935 [Nitrosovibrio sp. Nv4]
MQKEKSQQILLRDRKLEAYGHLKPTQITN